MDEELYEQGEEIIRQLMQDPNVARRIRREINLEMPDGSVNTTALIRLLRDPQFQSFRDENPQITQAANANFQFARSMQGLRTAADIARFGFGLHQIRQSRKLAPREPNYPQAPERNQNLQRAISREQARATRGRSESQRALDRQEDDALMRSSLQAASQFSGGQAASAQAGAQRALAQNARQRIRRGQQDERERQAGSSMVSQLIGRQMQEDARLDQFAMNRFRFRDMPLFNARSQARERLLSAGITNAFNGINPILNNFENTMRLYGPYMPGFVADEDLVSDPQSDYNDIFNNPLGRMVIETAGTTARTGPQQAATGLARSGTNSYLPGSRVQSIDPRFTNSLQQNSPQFGVADQLAQEEMNQYNASFQQDENAYMRNYFAGYQGTPGR